MQNADDQSREETRRALDLCARNASRAAGMVEPNPLVGAMIARPGAEPLSSRIISIGHHRRFGSLHAEADALRRAATLGADVRGCTMFVTLEPCNHTGKQPPCVDAIIAAGIAKVVIARRDPNPLAAGGADRLIASGVTVEFTDASARASRLSDPFVKRITSPLPWVIAKWAESADGRLTTPPGQDRWISGSRARRRVHRLRTSADAIITGAGTVLADDPRLTVRGIPIRRSPMRIVIDPTLRTLAAHHVIFDEQHLAPTMLAVVEGSAATSSANAPGIGMLTIPCRSNAAERIDLRALLTRLRNEHACHSALFECGPSLLSDALDQGVIDECVVFTSPHALGGADAPPPFTPPRARLNDLARWRLIDERTIGPDTQRTYRRA